MLPIVALGLSACTSLPSDLGRSDVDSLVAARGIPIEASDPANNKKLLESLTSQPLNAQRAMRIALINNSHLKASYAQLGIAAADVYAAGRIRNPVFSASVLDSNQPGDRDQLSFGLVASFTDLLTLSARTRLAKAEFAHMKHTIGAAVLKVAADAEAAYYHYVGAKQVAALRAQIAKAGLLSAALAERYHKAGNMTPRDLALDRAAAAEAQLTALQANAETYRLRTELATVMGLSVAGPWDAPTSLPVLLSQEDELVNLLALAKKSRLDLAAAYLRADILADRLGVTNWRRWLGELDIGVERERETDGTVLSGPVLEWELPIFTQHRDEWLRVDAELQIAITEIQRLKIDVENSVRLAYAATDNFRSRVDTYREQIIPARAAAVERGQEEENFMLIGIFEVLVAKQQEYDAYQGFFETVRDYWLSRVELARAVGNTLPSSKNISERQLDVEDYLPAKGSGKHSSHGSMGGEMSPTPMDHSQHKDIDSLEKAISPEQKVDAPDTHQQHRQHLDADGGSK